MILTVVLAVLAGLAGIRASQLWARESRNATEMPLLSPRERVLGSGERDSRPIGGAMVWTMLSTVLAALTAASGALLPTMRL